MQPESLIVLTNKRVTNENLEFAAEISAKTFNGLNTMFVQGEEFVELLSPSLQRVFDAVV